MDDHRKRTSLLRDSSWIKKPDEEDEAVDRDPNFGKTVLSRYHVKETITSSDTDEPRSPKVRSPSSSVLALTKRFSGNSDECSPPPSTKSVPSSTRWSTTSIETSVDEPKTSTTTKTITSNGTETTTTTTTRYTSKSTTKAETFSERVLSTSKGQAYASYSSPKVTKRTETITIKKESDDAKLGKDDVLSTDSPATVSTAAPVKSSSDDMHKLYDSLLPDPLTGDTTDSPPAVTTTTTVEVKTSSSDGDDLSSTSTKTIQVDDLPSTTTTKTSFTDDVKITTRTRPASTVEDDLYDTLLPKAITSPSRADSPAQSPSSTERSIRYSSYTDDSSSSVLSPKPRIEDDLYGSLLPKAISSPTRADSPAQSPSSTKRSIRYSSYTDDSPSSVFSSKPSYEYEYTSITSPTVHTSTTYRTSRSEDILTDPLYSKSSIKNVYTSPERVVLDKDLCTICHKPFTAEAKMVLDDMNIKCHASCFKCEVCNSTLGHLKAGDSMWVYKRMVHCDNCFEVTRDKWHR